MSMDTTQATVMESSSIAIDRSSLTMVPIKEEAEDLEMASSHDGSTVDNLSSSGDAGGAPEIARKETIMVNYSKVLVVVVILVMAAFVGFFTFKYVSSQEDTYYQYQFDNVARDIQASSKLRGGAIFDNLEGVSVSLTIQALTMGMEWPFVVFPHFQVLGMVSNSITGASTLAIAPVVKDEQREAWQNFTLRNSHALLAEGHQYDDQVHPDLYVETRYRDEPKIPTPFPLMAWNESSSMPFIWEFNRDNGQTGGPRPTGKRPSYIPIWQMAPAVDYATPLINLDTNTEGDSSYFNSGIIKYQKPILSSVIQANWLAFTYDQRFQNVYGGLPHSYVKYPVFDTLKEDREVVAILHAFLRWDQFFYNVLPEGEKPIVVVLTSTCRQQVFTYELRGETAFFLGEGDLHDPQYSHLGKTSAFQDLARLDNVDGFSCQFGMTIYPTAEWSENYFTNKPTFYAIAVVSCFLVTTLVFVIYDVLVQKRNRTVMISANKTNQIVSSLFPSNVRDRIMEEVKPKEKKQRKTWRPKASELAKSFTNMMDDSMGSGGARRSLNLNCMTSERIFGSQPIADLFPDVTVMFADMVGFTAWASVRDPTQVFSLLETVYHAIDLIVKRRRVFKVETIGDCYVACAGLPVPRKDHAVVMSRLAHDALHKMTEICHELESRLGPDTSQLCMRIGLHSGPVTAGVLRGDKGRFQLFGDTMNVASRMESTGVPRKVHLSKETADLLIAGGKGKWVTLREDKVFAKGKGELQTYFLNIRSESRDSMTETLSIAASLKDEEYDIDTYTTQDTTNRMRLLAALTPPEDVEAKNMRLINWNVDVLGGLLRHVIAHRRTRRSTFSRGSTDNTPKRAPQLKLTGGDLMNEVVDVLSLPKFDESLYKKHVDPDTVVLPSKAVEQLREFVTQIAQSYNSTTSFHNFEHASHVIMSVTKMMNRIVNPIEISRQKGPEYKFASTLHEFSYGITSDPLTQLAAVFAALVHDLDHPGVPNTTLVKENDPMARKYNGKSVAEQNSVELAWEILMQPGFEELRACIYTDEDELHRFRSLVVNLVLATDIMDKDLGSKRKARWARAFDTKEQSSPESTHMVVNRKATIVLEHLIQASDIAHTMQHWHVYRKWNERLFCEMLQAYEDGRSDKDPSDGWYQGEIGFFDFYIIPLAKKLETCNVFGVSSSEYLGYAEANRAEWVKKGEDLVKVYLERFKLRKTLGRDGCFPSHEDLTELAFGDDLPESAPQESSIASVHGSDSSTVGLAYEDGSKFFDV